MPHQTERANQGTIPLVEDKPELTLFIAAREQFQKVRSMLPERWQPSHQTVAEIIFATEAEFRAVHVQNSIRGGYDPAESEELADHIYMSRHGVNLSYSRRKAIRQLEGDIVQFLPDQQRTDLYATVLFHEIGHDFVANYYDIGLEKAAEICYETPDEFLHRISGSLFQDPILLSQFVSEQTGVTPTELLAHFQDLAKQHGKSPAGLIRELLLQTPDKFFSEFLSLDIDEYRKYVSDRLSKLTFDVNGRTVLVRLEGRMVTETAEAHDHHLKEVIADAYTLYVQFLLFCHEKGWAMGKSIRSKLMQFKDTEYFKSLLSPDNLLMVPIFNAVKELDSFEKFLDIVADTLDVFSSSNSSLTKPQIQAFTRVAEASQASVVANLIMTEFTNDYEFRLRTSEQIIERLNPGGTGYLRKLLNGNQERYEQSVLASVENLAQRGPLEFAKQIMLGARGVAASKVEAAAHGVDTSMQQGTSVTSDLEVTSPISAIFHEVFYGARPMNVAEIFDRTVALLEAQIELQ